MRTNIHSHKRQQRKNTILLNELNEAENEVKSTEWRHSKDISMTSQEPAGGLKIISVIALVVATNLTVGAFSARARPAQKR